MSLPEKICEQIAMCNYELLDWIDPKRLVRQFLAMNPNIRTIIETIMESNYSLALGLGWVEIGFFNHAEFSANPIAVPFLKKYPDKISWHFLCRNPDPEAIELIGQNLNNYDLDWRAISANPSAVELIKTNLNKVFWVELARNPNPKVIEILRAKPAKIYLKILAQNPCDEALCLFLERMNGEKIPLELFSHLCENPNPKIWKLFSEAIKTKSEIIDWGSLSKNPNPEVVKFLTENRECIVWHKLCKNPNPDVVPLLREKAKTEPDKLSWTYLCENPATVEILKEYPSKIKWGALSANPSIFRPTRNGILYKVLMAI